MVLRQAHTAVIVPKLVDAAAKQAFREKLNADIEKYIGNGGEIEHIPIGKGQSWKDANKEASEKGKEGARKNAISRGYQV